MIATRIHPAGARAPRTRHGAGARWTAPAVGARPGIARAWPSAGGLLLALLASTAPASAAAQGAAIAGRVLDAGTARPVAGAVVTLEPAPGGLVVDPASSTLQPTRSVVTTQAGSYRFAGLPPGRYRLSVQRLGYRGAIVEAEVKRPIDASISVALQLEPVALEPVFVRDRATTPFQRRANGADGSDAVRAASERARQTMFLTPDARMLTYDDVMDGVTLGEADVFRALQRFAGVATRDDYTAELWSRGAPWSQTRVTFDGMPLFNPVHAVGVLSAVTPEVLGVVFFHPGVRPVSSGEGGAAAVDLRSRPGGGHGEVHGVADISMASAKLALEQRTSDRGAWLVAGRRSYFDVLRRGLDWLRIGNVDLPYVFHDLTGRIDAPLGPSAALEASGLWEEDRLYGDVTGVLEHTRARWGNRVGRVTIAASPGSLRTRHTAGISRYAARVQEFDAVDRLGPPPWAEPRSENDITFLRLSGDLSPAAEPGATVSPGAWSAGYDVSWRTLRYDGPQPRYHPVKPDTIRRITRAQELFTAALWVDARVAVAPRLAFNPGLRVEGGGDVAGTPAVRVAPALALRWTPAPDRAVSLALARSWQYEQAIALAGPSPHPAFHASQFWVFAGSGVPALRADIATLGVEQWLGGRWLGGVTAYVRRSEGIALPDPTPGALVRRPFFVIGDNDARGLDVSVRRIGARWSAAFAYSLGVSEMHAAGLAFPATADRRHALDVLAGVRLPAGLRLSAALTAMSGAPYTRALSRATEEECTLFGFGCSTSFASVQEPNALRTPAYASLDAAVQWRGSVAAVELSAYAQVRNVLDRDNASTYSGTAAERRTTRAGDMELIVRDRFERGLPRLPLIGARIAF